MSTSSNTTPVAQSPSPPVKGTLTKTTTKAPETCAPKAPMKASTKAPTVIGRSMGGSNTMNCHHDWVLRAHPTIPYTSLFCKKCDVEKR